MASKESRKRLYNRLRVLRIERELSRADLAQKVGVNVQTIGFIERGDYVPSLELGLKIARSLSVPVEMVFSLDPIAPLSEQVAHKLA